MWWHDDSSVVELAFDHSLHELCAIGLGCQLLGAKRFTGEVVETGALQPGVGEPLRERLDDDIEPCLLGSSDGILLPLNMSDLHQDSSNACRSSFEVLFDDPVVAKIYAEFNSSCSSGSDLGRCRSNR